MKLLFLRTASVILLFSAVFLVNFIFTDTSIDLRNCQPSNIISKLKRAYDPLMFSIKQHNDLESFYDNYSISDAIDVCVRMHSNNTIDKNSCINSAYQHQKNINICYEFWTGQCKANGGRCEKFEFLLKN